MPDFDKVSLAEVIVGGEPVAFTKSTGTLHLAGTDLQVNNWKELRRRVDLFFTRAGLMENPKRANDPASGTSSFLTYNLKQILNRDRGIIRKPPWFLRPFFAAVITKEELR